MFLTRLGDGSRMVVTGDITQVDLPSNKRSGLKRGDTYFKKLKQCLPIFTSRGRRSASPARSGHY